MIAFVAKATEAFFMHEPNLFERNSMKKVLDERSESKALYPFHENDWDHEIIPPAPQHETLTICIAIS